MEDISRELEKEIDSYSSPARRKRKSETKLIAVDDFGKMKSADWIKKALLSLSILSFILLATTILFYKLYVTYRVECTDLRENLNLALNTTKDLIKEKEYLMAKLVILDNNFDKPEEEVKETSNDVQKVIESKVAKVVKTQPRPESKSILFDVPKVVSPEATAIVSSEIESTPEAIKNVKIERFMIVKDKITGDLNINFRVLNVASEKGDASGRVFVVLSDRDEPAVNKLVVPTVPLEGNVPSQPRRGQYFSIAHFKTVKFKIKNIPNPELFTKAIVFVFGQGNALILNEEINIAISK